MNAIEQVREALRHAAEVLEIYAPIGRLVSRDECAVDEVDRALATLERYEVVEGVCLPSSRKDVSPRYVVEPGSVPGRHWRDRPRRAAILLVEREP